MAQVKVFDRASAEARARSSQGQSRPSNQQYRQQLGYCHVPDNVAEQQILSMLQANGLRTYSPRTVEEFKTRVVSESEIRRIRLKSYYLWFTRWERYIWSWRNPEGFISRLIRASSFTYSVMVILIPVLAFLFLMMLMGFTNIGKTERMLDGMIFGWLKLAGIVLLVCGVGWPLLLNLVLPENLNDRFKRWLLNLAANNLPLYWRIFDISRVEVAVPPELLDLALRIRQFDPDIQFCAEITEGHKDAKMFDTPLTTAVWSGFLIARVGDQHAYLAIWNENQAVWYP